MKHSRVYRCCPGSTALMYAAHGGHEDICKALLEALQLSKPFATLNPAEFLKKLRSAKA